MDIFWSTIAGYNSSTWFLQLIIVIAGVFLTGLLLKKPTPRVKLAMKLYLLFLYLWIAVVYYYIYCAERSYNGTMALLGNDGCYMDMGYGNRLYHAGA